MFAKSPLMTLSELSANGIVSRIWSEPGRASPASTRLRRIGCSARRSATVLAWLRRITSVPTSESRFSDCSVPTSRPRCWLSTSRPGPRLSMTFAIRARWSTRVRLSRSRESIARTMSAFCRSSVPTNWSRFCSRDRSWASLPVVAALSSRAIVWTFSTPPPLSSSDSAPSTSSTCAPTSVRSAGITAPAARRPCGGSVGEGISSTNFSPRRLVWRRRAVALAGRTTAPLTSTTTWAVQPSGASETSRTTPTGTSLTRTLLFGTRSTTLVNCAVTM